MKRNDLPDGEKFNYVECDGPDLRYTYVSAGGRDIAADKETAEAVGHNTVALDQDIVLIVKAGADPVSPDYYAGLTPEPIEVIRAWGLDVGPDADHYRASAIPYIARAGKKGGEEKYVEDLRKAIRFLEWAIEAREAK